MKVIETVLTNDNLPLEKLQDDVLALCSELQNLVIQSSQQTIDRNFERARELYLQAESIFTEKLLRIMPKGKITRDERKKKLDKAALLIAIPPDRMRFYLNELLNETHYQLSRLFLNEQLTDIVLTIKRIKQNINHDDVDAQFNDLLRVPDHLKNTLNTVLPRARATKSLKTLSNQFFTTVNAKITRLGDVLEKAIETRCSNRYKSLAGVRKELFHLKNKVIDLKQRGYQREGEALERLRRIIKVSNREYVNGSCHLTEYQSRIQRAVDKVTPILNTHRSYNTLIPVALVNMMIAVMAVATVGTSALFSYAATGRVFFKPATDSETKKENIADAVKQVTYKK